MSDTTKQVLRKLVSDHVGQNNAITQSRLAEATGLNPSTLRSELRRIREERKIPLANQRDGYYVIADKSELQDYIGHINQEIESKKQTIEYTLEAWDEFDGDIEIEPEQEVGTQGYECRKCGKTVPRDKCNWPKEGEYENEPLCRACFGGVLTSRGSG